jgi:Domain of unknown function (DUF4440)
MPWVQTVLLVLLFWLAPFRLAAPALAQTSPGASNADAAVHAEILAFREAIRAAVAAQDRAALERFYADKFSHIRDTGRIDLKGDRIALLLSGASAIETAPEDELEVQSYGSGAAAAIGVSRVVDGGTDRPAPFRWLTVYVRDGAAWRVALSQASRIAGRR